MRRIATTLVALLGIALMIVGIWGAQPAPYSPDPRLFAGATFWIAGIVLLIASPAVYCLVQE